MRSAPRTSLLSANKEGLVSLPGYLALSLAGSACAPLLHNTHILSKRLTSADAPLPHAREATQRMRVLLLLGTSMWLAASAADTYVESTSRRLCNVPYALWVISQTCLALALATAREVVGADRVGFPAPPPLLKAVNSFPLSVFLLANLLTGAVNLSVDTMTASDTVAAAVLCAYMLVVCAAAVALDDGAPMRWLSTRVFL